MAQTSSNELEHPQVLLTGLTLAGLTFRQLGGMSDADQGFEIKVAMGFARPSEDSLGVEMALDVVDPGAFHVKIAYRAVLERIGEPNPNLSDEQFWREVASQIAPVVIYPHMRAVFSIIVTQAGHPSYLLPLINPVTLVNKAEVEIPAFVAEETKDE